MNQIPSVGRIVHYRAHGSPDGTHKPAARAAVITIVHPEVLVGEVGNRVAVEDVGLCVMNPSGLFFNEHCLYDGSENPRGGTWQWPPRV